MFDFGERLGLFLIVEAGALSAVAVTATVLYMGYRLVLTKSNDRPRKGNGQSTEKKRKNGKLEGTSKSNLTDTLFILNLMVAELIQSMGSLLNIQWIIDAGIFPEHHGICKAQGATKQIGDVAVAFTSLIIALHTFSVLVFRWRAPSIVAYLSLGFIWLFVILGVAVSSGIHGDNYYGNTGYWCWIRKDHPIDRLALEYVWLWTAAGLMLVMYGIIALVMRGLVVIDRGIQFHIKKASRITDDNVGESLYRKDIANVMMFYPAVYIVCVLPLSIVRWLAFANADTHHSVPPGATMLASFLFSLSGFFNATLYRLTRPDIVFGQVESHDTNTTNQRTINGDGHLPDIEGDLEAGGAEETGDLHGEMGHLPRTSSDG